MLAQRPRIGPHLHPRPRLLGRMPDSPGWVVWLEAPYGYGKSVLAAQWAQAMEVEGWRVRWLSVAGRGLRQALALLLDLPRDSDWPALREALWVGDVLLVVEDLDEGDEITPLLSGMGGLLLLASRGHLSSQELPRLLTQGRLLHLQTADLGFTLEEAMGLFDDPALAEAAWASSAGWALPLHFSALRGEAMDPEALAEGVRDSLGSEAWQEALWLAALPYLPQGAADETSRKLAAAGFCQEIEAGYRMHALVAEALLRAYPHEVAAVVLRERQRLPLEMQAESLARSGQLRALGELIENDPVPGRLGSLDPAGMLRWDALCVGEPGPGRLLSRAWAQSVLGMVEETLASQNAVLDHPDAQPEQLLAAISWRLFEMRPEQSEEAEALLERAQAPLAAASPRSAAAFLANASIFHYKCQDWLEVAAMQERALALLEGLDEVERHTSVLRHRLAEVRWELHGELLAYIEASERQHRAQAGVSPYNAAVAQHALGVFRDLIGDPRADEHFQAAEAAGEHNRFTALSAAAERACMQGRTEAFADLVTRFGPWRDSFPEMGEHLHELWARSLRLKGLPQEALDVLAGQEGLAVAGERALALHALGREQEARQALPDPELSPLRLTRLQLLAARYRLEHRSEDLEGLLSATDVGARLLPALLPLASLPEDRPELSDAYPLPEVLASRWEAAVARRADQIPPLRVELLGAWRVRLLGEEVALTERQREMLSLMALGLDREAIGEAMWPEVEAAKVRNNLHVQLTMLRRVLEPWGRRTYLGRGGLERTDVDLWRLRQALSDGDAAAVVRLYREPLAPGVESPRVAEAREELRALVLGSYKRAASIADPVTALDFLDAALRIDPLDEEALSASLGKLSALGRTREAQRRFQDFARLLQQETGLEPLPGTRAALSG